jgi:hypothetical protein
MTTVLQATDEGLVNAETGELVGGELFDPKPYTTPVPTLDGHRADTVKLTFAGGVEIDLMIEDDLEWFKSLRFGQELELHVTATVAKTGWTIKTSADGDETVAHTLGLNVHSYTIDSDD